MNRPAYCERASITVGSSVLYTAIYLLVTSTRPNLVTNSFLPSSRIEVARNEHDLNLCSVTSNLIITLIQIDVLISLGEIRIKKVLNIVKELSGYFLIETDFIDKYVTSICSAELMLISLNTRRIEIILTCTRDKFAKAAAKASKEGSQKDSDHIIRSEWNKTLRLKVAKILQPTIVVYTRY